VNSNKYKSAWLSAHYRSSVWMMVAAVLLVSNLLLSIFVLHADTSEKTIIVPPSLNKPFWIRGTQLSPDYIEQMAAYFSQLLLTYHPQNARSQFESVLRYTDPHTYNAMKAKLYADAQRITRNEISSVFYPMGIHISNTLATINGELVGMIGQQVVSRKQKYYGIQFDYRNGSLFVESFNELIPDGSGKNFTKVEAENESLVDPASVNSEVR